MAHLIISKVSSSSETEGSAAAQGYSNTDHMLTCLVAQVTMCLIFNHQIKIKAWKPFSSLRMCEHLMVIASTASPGVQHTAGAPSKLTESHRCCYG